MMFSNENRNENLLYIRAPRGRGEYPRNRISVISVSSYLTTLGLGICLRVLTLIGISRLIRTEKGCHDFGKK